MELALKFSAETPVATVSPSPSHPWWTRIASRGKGTSFSTMIEIFLAGGKEDALTLN